MRDSFYGLVRELPPVPSFFANACQASYVCDPCDSCAAVSVRLVSGCFLKSVDKYFGHCVLLCTWQTHCALTACIVVRTPDLDIALRPLRYSSRCDVLRGQHCNVVFALWDCWKSCECARPGACAVCVLESTGRWCHCRRDPHGEIIHTRSKCYVMWWGETFVRNLARGVNGCMRGCLGEASLQQSGKKTCI